MFERRLKLLMVMLALPVVAIALRLVQLQVARGGQYRQESEKKLLKDPRFFPCLRGNITDHEGRFRLAYDAPSWNLCVQYRVIAGDREYLRVQARRRFPQLDPPAAEEAMQDEIAASWQLISRLTGRSTSDLEATCSKIVREVTTVKKVVSERRKIQTELAEERMAHPVVKGLDQSQQVIARERLRPYEWVEVIADQTRQYAGGPAVGHFLGRLGEVSREDLQSDPERDDELARYLAGDLRGISGVEAIGERVLRGRRGRIQEDIRGRPVPGTPMIEPAGGKTFRLTIDLPLQQDFYKLLQAAVESSEYSTGGAAVLLDIPSRQVLAMVSYPGYDPNTTWKDWLALAEDELHQPAQFRPTQMHYPPGSTVKPMLLAGALTDGTVSPDTHFTCEGRLFREFEDRWRCLGIHGSINPVTAVQHSCNVFFYHVGELMGTPRQASWMQQFGFGSPAGTHLAPESPGHLPENANAGFARLAGIGQGEVDATPMQVANMMASIASGVWRPVTIWADDPDPRPARKLTASSAALRLVREGMYRVVNAPGGTAFEHATLRDAGDYILIGKTGSATASRRVAERVYTVHLPDGSVREEASASERAMRAKYPGAEIKGGRPCKYWPPEGVDPTHAWFVGYVTTKQHYLEPNNAGRLNVAIAVIVEYGGHGNTVAGPAAAAMLRQVIERQQESPAATGG